MLSRVLGLYGLIVERPDRPGFGARCFLLPCVCPICSGKCSPKGRFQPVLCSLFAEKSQEEGEDAAQLFASTVASVLLLTLGLATILAIIFMRPIVTWMNPAPESLALTIQYARITSIYLLCMVITALITGVLNSKQHFAAGAFAPILFNICTIGGLVISVGYSALTASPAAMPWLSPLRSPGWLRYCFCG